MTCLVPGLSWREFSLSRLLHHLQLAHSTPYRMVWSTSHLIIPTVLNTDESSAQIRWWRCCVPKHLLMGHISAPWCSTEHIIPLSLLSRPHTQARAFSHLFASPDHCSPSLNWHPRQSETLYGQHDSAARGRLIVTTSSNAGHSLSLKMTDSLKKPRSKAISHKK